MPIAVHADSGSRNLAIPDRARSDEGRDELNGGRKLPESNQP